MTVSALHAAAVEISAPAEALVGSEVPVAWTGEANARDFITIVAPDAVEGAYEAYQYARKSPVTLVAPVEPGTYEIRYLGADAPYPTLARRPLTVNDTSATLLAPDSVDAGAAFDVSWTGPDHKRDFITIVPAGTPEGQYRSGYAYTSKGSPLKLMAPDTAGDYELRYLTGQTISLLARTPITVTPVTASVSGPATIEARNATPAEPGEYEYRYMTGQTNQVLVGPLDRSAAAKVASINAMNLAKTPIAATLANAGAGLAGQPGPHLIILLTDGEETCDGHPAEVIRSLAGSGLDVRVNIVGFAIDELMLRETFQEWARLGNGTNLDARNAVELSAGLSNAIEVPFEVLDEGGNVVASGVVNGPAVELLPGSYGVRASTSGSQIPASVVADEESIVSLEPE
jgi:hypothetical protein